MTFEERLALISLTLGLVFLLLTNRFLIVSKLRQLKQYLLLLKSAFSSIEVGTIQTKASHKSFNEFAKNFISLAPTENADQDGKYSEALNWALQKDDVLNIALTGPYGAGKTSVLKTFFLKHKYNFLNVSLAKFSQTHNTKENKETFQSEVRGVNGEYGEEHPAQAKPEEDITDYSDDTSGFLLEKSILQQILYTEEQRKLPYSRFARVYDYDLISKLYVAVPLLTFFLLIFTYTFENEWFKSNLNSLNSGSLWLSLPIYFLLMSSFIWLTILMLDYMRNLSIDKFNLFSGDFQFSESHGASALNIHLDELIYFFEVTSYRVIVFEDLDRFSNTSIFTKLREINTLINNSKQVKKNRNWFQKLLKKEHHLEPIRFIYAVKDELFSDATDRTKFFDFVLPIIPYVSDQNSRQLLMDKLRQIGKLDDINESVNWKSFIRDITLYVDDMRLLTNIFNEFLIYEAKLLDGFKKTDSKMLFAFILYKNKYPKDFSDLYKGGGYIQSAFNKKRHLISQKIQDAESKIKVLKLEMDNIKDEPLESLEELRTLILGAIIKSDNASPLQIHSGSTWEPAKDYFESESKFESLLAIQSIHMQKGNSSVPLSKTDILNGDWKIEYKRRKDLLEQQKAIKITSISQEISRLSKKQQDLRLFSLVELLEDSELDSEEVFESNCTLLKLLIRKGYINENFSHYLNFFHDGDLSKADKDFVFSVKGKNPLPYENHIQNIEVVLEELDEADFKVDAILNYQLIEYLLDINPKDKRLTHVFKILSENFIYHHDFIEDFLRTSQKRDSFTVQMASTWPSFWLSICSGLTDDNLKKELTNIIICELGISDLKNLNIDGVLAIYISKNISIFKDYRSIAESKFIELVDELELVIGDISYILSIYPQSIEHLLKSCAYEINVKNLSDISRTLSESIDFKTLNHDELASLHPSLKKYLGAHPEKYIFDYALEVEDLVESEQTIEMFLSDNELSEHLKTLLIENIDFKISTVELIHDKSFWEPLLINNKVLLTWKNILLIFNQLGELSEYMIKLLNEHVEELIALDLDQSLYQDELGFSESLEEFYLPIVYCKQLTDYTVIKLLSKHSFYMEGLDFERLSVERVRGLLDEGCIEFNSENIEQMGENFPDCVVTFIEKNIKKYLELEEIPTLNYAALLGVINSTKINESDKSTIVISQQKGFSNLIIEEANELLLTLRNQSELILTVDVLLPLVQLSNVHSSKLEILSQQLSNLTDTDISNFFEAIGLKKITEAYNKGSNASIDAGELTEELLYKLKDRGFLSSYRLKKGKYRIYFYGS
ncbi:MAG: Uncharacterised protein [Pseudidiomarina mangrovi]|nr:MAG: Uncharacterised protein [Pseudidiomarina mangrovi]